MVNEVIGVNQVIRVIRVIWVRQVTKKLINAPVDQDGQISHGIWFQGICHSMFVAAAADPILVSVHGLLSKKANNF